MDRSNVISIQKHLNVEDLLRLRDGSADAKTIEHVTRHLAACERCASFAREMFADEGPQALGAALRGPEVEAFSLPRRRTPMKSLGIAAAIALVIGGSAALLYRSRAGSWRLTVDEKPVSRQLSAAKPIEQPAAYEHPEWNALVRDALASGRVTIVASAAASYADTLRGGDARAKLAGEMTPSATAVESQQPQLSWPAIAGARYVVSIVSEDEVIARSGTLDVNRWTPKRPLSRGRSYAWQVRVTADDHVETLPAPPLPNPQFRVIGEHAARDLGDARRQHPGDPLLLGVLAAHYGLREEARNQLAQYAAAHPAAAPLRLDGSS